MRPFILVALLCTSLISCQTSPTVDYAAMDIFWQMVDEWEQDKEPGEEMWQALFATPAYRYLTTVEDKEALFRHHFPIVFMPSNEVKRDSIEQAGPDRYFSHYLLVARERAAIQAFESELRARPLMDNALALTRDFLPPGMLDTRDIPPVAFGIFEPDGKANGDIVVVDLAFARMIDLTAFLAHEAHHFYKSELNRMRQPDDGDEHKPLLRAIRQLQTEGVADLIDKRNLLETMYQTATDESWYGARYKEYARGAAGTFAEMDSLIQDLANNPERVGPNSVSVWNSLPFGAHPHGGVMAYMVEKALGTQAIIETLENPFSFLREYNRAAILTPGAHVFSDRTMNYLALLESRYLD